MLEITISFNEVDNNGELVERVYEKRVDTVLEAEGAIRDGAEEWIRLDRERRMVDSISEAKNRNV